ncbi:MAG: ATP-dependent RNA helicase HrpA, partial [Planctomycetota bacterium]
MKPKPSSPKLDSKPESSGSPLDDAMGVDRKRLARSKRRLTEAEFGDKLQESVERRKRRETYEPKLDYPDELPISRYREEIVQLIRERQVLVVCGETGSGKSTQLPKFCLEAGRGRSAMIGHTQPRRLAARSIADRLAEEMECRVGDQVGYQVRFGDQTGPDTLIKLMTDGILLAETSRDRSLDQYDTIIIDEAHERSLNIDFLLAYLKQLLAKRSDLKVIITSATIDAERFSEHFADEQGPAPIFNVEGRGYPVEIRYLPWEDVVADEFRGYDLSHHVVEAVKRLSRDTSGDCLVFLPTERDIRMVSHRVAGHYKRLGLEGRVEILPLYARLPQKDQQKIFHPSGQTQRIIFATNVAESSLTVPGIHSVIDAGTARISRYSPRSKLQRLPIESVSRASSDQRAGRCGRVGPGICVRLYSETDYETREAFTTPEIRRTNLASVVLQAKMLGFQNLESLPLLDVPRPESIREGVQTLRELGALDEQQELTEIGRTLGRLPIDPRIGRIVLAAEEQGVLAEVLPIAAALELPDPRQRPPDKQQAADEAHAEFRDPQSDFLGFLRLWRYYENLRAEGSRVRRLR